MGFIEFTAMPTGTMEIAVSDSPQPGLRLATLTGNLSLETVSLFNQKLREDNSPALIVDLSGVGYFDSAGVGALVQLLVRRGRTNQPMALAGVNVRNRAVLEVAQVAKLFQLFTTAAEAEAQFAKSGKFS
jgi:anti-sigma B factor antagonist